MKKSIEGEKYLHSSTLITEELLQTYKEWGKFVCIASTEVTAIESNLISSINLCLG